jgi:hypothetical protein
VKRWWALSLLPASSDMICTSSFGVSWEFMVPMIDVDSRYALYVRGAFRGLQLVGSSLVHWRRLRCYLFLKRKGQSNSGNPMPCENSQILFRCRG